MTAANSLSGSMWLWQSGPHREWASWGRGHGEVEAVVAAAASNETNSRGAQGAQPQEPQRLAHDHRRARPGLAPARASRTSRSTKCTAEPRAAAGIPSWRCGETTGTSASCAPISPAAPPGYTFLHRAAYAGREDACRELIRRGASLSAVTHDGRTAADVADGRGHSEIARFCAELSEEPWVPPQDPRGRCPAASRGATPSRNAPRICSQSPTQTGQCESPGAQPTSRTPSTGRSWAGTGPGTRRAAWTPSLVCACASDQIAEDWST